MSGLSERVRRLAREGWLARERVLQRRPEYLRAREGLGGERAVLFEYLAGTLPVTDLGDYPPELLVSGLDQALAVREEFSWCAALPEYIFLKDVLCPRVNNEKLADCRGLFRRELAPRVEGLALPEAILAVNRWCAGQVTYRSTDDTTSSALDIYRRGWGRCGEETVFAVNALRSVGIAARQVYAPRWSHCDDNHAWVEAFDGKNWRYLGACEPEPRLDMGWFTAAAGRAMLCHTKIFVGELESWRELFPTASPLDLDRREGVAYESVTARYAGVRPVTVTVTDEKGESTPNTEVELALLNDGALFPIARRVTDERGAAALTLGLGSVWVTARREGLFAEGLMNTAQTGELVLTLGSGAVPEGEFDFSAPKDSGKTPPALTAGEKTARREALAQAKNERESRPAFTPVHPENCWRVVETLTEKDRAGELPAEALEESLPALKWEKELPGEVFRQALFSPRIGLEPLAPWRKMLEGIWEDVPPGELWLKLKENISGANSFGELPQTPAGAWKLGLADESGRTVLFCALCRTRGIPARLGPDGGPEYWQEGAFRRADGLRLGTITLKDVGDGQGRWSLSRWEDRWRLVTISLGAPTQLPEGRYRLITSVRLPDGDQLGWFREFRLRPGEELTVTPEFRTPEEGQLLQRLPLPELGFPAAGLLCWVQPGEEPTEHLLGELKPVWERLAELGCRVHMICREPEKVKGMKGAEAHLWDEDVAEAVARRMYLEPGRFPLVVLVDERGDGRFACAGYNVGLGELAARLASVTAGAGYPRGLDA